MPLDIPPPDDPFNADALAECAAGDACPEGGEVIPERMHVSGYCTTCCPLRDLTCVDCWGADTDEEDDA